MERNSPKILCLFFLLSMALTQKYHISHPVYLGIIVLLPYWSYLNIEKYTVSRNEIIISGIYSLLLSLAIVAGTQVHYVEMRSSASENYINLDISCVLTGIVLAFLVHPIIIFTIKLIQRYSIGISFSKNTLSRKSFFIIWLIIFLFWVPYLLTYYPGGIVGDGACTLEESLQPGIPDHNHWVVLYILVLRLFLLIGSYFSADMNVGIFLYATVEAFIFSGVCAAIVYKLRKKTNIRFWWIIVAYYALSGFFASYSITLWKDALFSAGIILIVLLLWDFSQNGFPSIRYCLKFALLGFL